MLMEQRLRKLELRAKEEKWYIDFNNLKIKDKPFASGSTSFIYNGTWIGTNIAVKALKEQSEKNLHFFINEIEFWNKIRHPNIVQFLGISIKNNKLYIIIQKINGTDLKDYILCNKNLNIKKRIYIISQLSLILKFLHNSKPSVIYTDLKPENILIENNKVYLTDFGLCQFIPEDKDTLLPGNIGTLRYMAPEVYNYQNYDCKADIYSFGMIIFFIFKQELPFSNFKRNCLGDYFGNCNDYNFSIYNKEIEYLIKKCITKNVASRFNIEEAIEFINNINIYKLNYNCLLYLLFNK
jgi:serine/threonine protein kinase